MKELGDLYVAAMLKVRGHRLVRVSGDGRRARWAFEETPEMASDLAGYYSGKVQVVARDYADAVRSTKGEAMNTPAGHQ